MSYFYYLFWHFCCRMYHTTSLSGIVLTWLSCLSSRCLSVKRDILFFFSLLLLWITKGFVLFIVHAAHLSYRPISSNWFRTVLHVLTSRPLKPCPHCRRKVRLSQKTATVAEFCDSLTFLRQYSRTFLYARVSFPVSSSLFLSFTFLFQA